MSELPIAPDQILLSYQYLNFIETNHVYVDYLPENLLLAVDQIISIYPRPDGLLTEERARTRQGTSADRSVYPFHPKNWATYKHKPVRQAEELCSALESIGALT